MGKGGGGGGGGGGVLHCWFTVSHCVVIRVGTGIYK